MLSRWRTRRHGVGTALLAPAVALSLAACGSVEQQRPVGAVGSTGRDALLWPFAASSIWNTPRGADATLVPADLAAPHVDLDVDYFVVTDVGDPLTPTYQNATFGQGRCTGMIRQPQAAYEVYLGQPIHVPTHLVLPDATNRPYSTPNNSSAFLDPDGRTLHQFNVTARCTAGGPLYGYRVADQDIRGDGRLGGHLGSGLSSIGGDIRAGELFGAQPLRHALKIDVDGTRLAYAEKSATPGFRWPAVQADAAAPHDYRGSDLNLVMGSLLTIRTSATAASLGLTTPEGHRLLTALQDYGAYVADTTGSADASLCVEATALPDYRTRTGIALNDARALQADLVRLFGALQVVIDDSPDDIGGAGRRLGTPAPALAP